MKTKRLSENPRQQAGTPQDLFNVLDAEYRFTIDVCASEHNAKVGTYLTREDNALDADWVGERVFCNPLFDDIGAWLDHAMEPIIAVYLLPVRTDRLWWKKAKPWAEVHWFVGEKPHRRIQFVPPPGVKYSSNPDCNCLLCFGEEFTKGLEVWRSGLTGERI